MEHQKTNRKLNSVLANKKIVYPAIAVAALILIILVVWFFNWEARHNAEKAAQSQKAQAAQTLLEKKNNSSTSRPSFFLSAPVGARAGIDIRSYIQGYWRMVDTSGTDKKMTIFYVKNPDYTAPLLYIRYDDKANFKLAAGETLFKTNSTKYSFAYFFYPVDSYPGKDKDDFSLVQSEFKDQLPTFNIF